MSIERDHSPLRSSEITVVNNTQNNTQVNNYYLSDSVTTQNITSLEQTLQTTLLTTPTAKRLTQKDAEAVGLFKKVFEEENITQKEHLIATVARYAKSVDAIFENKEDESNYCELAREIIQLFRKAELPMKDVLIPNALEGTAEFLHEIDLTPRELILHLSELLWQSTLLPSLHRDILARVIERPVRVGDNCAVDQYVETREIKTQENVVTDYSLGMLLPGDDGYDDNNDDDDDDDVSEEALTTTVWAREDIDSFIRTTMRRVYELICHVVVVKWDMMPENFRELKNIPVSWFAQRVLDGERTRFDCQEIKEVSNTRQSGRICQRMAHYFQSM